MGEAGIRGGTHAKNQRLVALAETTTNAVGYAVQDSADGDALRQRSVIGGSKPFTLQPM